jgi:hypothetical protein
MKATEFRKLIREEISKVMGKGDSIQSIYDNLLSSNNELDNWLTDNMITSDAVKIKRKGAEYFEMLQNALIKKQQIKL